MATSRPRKQRLTAEHHRVAEWTLASIPSAFGAPLRLSAPPEHWRVTARDRSLARRVLSRVEFRNPLEMRARSVVDADTVLDLDRVVAKMAFLIELAAPLPPRLRDRVEPWVIAAWDLRRQFRDELRAFAQRRGLR